MQSVAQMKEWWKYENSFELTVLDWMYLLLYNPYNMTHLYLVI